MALLKKYKEIKQMLGLLDLGIIGIVLLILICIILLPIVLTLIVGIGFANMFGFTGIYWWAFVILFYLIICAILSALGI